MYAAIPAETAHEHSNKLHRTKSGNNTHHRPHIEPGMSYTTIAGSSSRVATISEEAATDTSSILSSSSDDSVEEDLESFSVHQLGAAHHSHHIDIRGWALTRSVEFWMLFSLLGILTGVGLMTIK